MSNKENEPQRHRGHRGRTKRQRENQNQRQREKRGRGEIPNPEFSLRVWVTLWFSLSVICLSLSFGSSSVFSVPLWFISF
jgi:hypothetical protein